MQLTSRHISDGYLSSHAHCGRLFDLAIAPRCAMRGMWMGLPTKMAFAHNVQVMLNEFATCMMLIVPNIVSKK